VAGLVYVFLTEYPLPRIAIAKLIYHLASKKSMKSIIGIIMALLAPFAMAAQVKPAKPVTKPASGAIQQKSFSNGIKIKSKGLVVSDAKLYFDDQSSVPADNLVEVNQRVNMLITIDKGWSEIDGKVYPGGSEVIKLNNGAMILKSNDLFKAYDETGVSPEDARYITLKAVITEMRDKKKYVIVTFRVWDKKSTAEITGSYKLYIK
jgi:hypothetical protein